MKKKLSYATIIVVTIAEAWLCWEGYKMKRSIKKLEAIYESDRSGWQGAQLEP